ncbi:hypothetical protein [Roseovarius sp.]|uniref:hypothetical protein n=1 Tax=Roseovarius sp. TaxID=1486281 RepID=UPI003569168C
MSHIVIHGLRRSGTTILWETFRTDPALRCFDEPFHPRLAHGARDNHKGTWREMSAHLLHATQPPASINPRDELLANSTPEQIAWLGSLCASHDRVVTDIVRGWNRAPGLHAASGEVLTVHLVRDPASWVAAHLLPTGQKTPLGRMADLYRKHSFFHRHGFYDNYKYETIVNAALAQNHPVFRFVRPSAAALRRAPACDKLLAFWWGANVTLAQRLASARAPSLMLTLAEFSRAPEAELHRVAEAAGWAEMRVDTRAVRPVKPSFNAGLRRWQASAVRLGLPEDLFDPAAQEAERLRAAFEAALPA